MSITEITLYKFNTKATVLRAYSTHFTDRDHGKLIVCLRTLMKLGFIRDYKIVQLSEG
jgi:hypothetical protein